MRELPTFTLFIMAHMKWIYAMIQDNSYHAFKMITVTAQENKVDKFKWDNSWIDTVYATYVVEFVEKKGMPDYNKHIISPFEL